VGRVDGFVSIEYPSEISILKRSEVSSRAPGSVLWQDFSVYRFDAADL